MFSNFTPWSAGRTAAGHAYAGAFVAGVETPEPRDPKLMRFIFVCWVLIAVKHVAIIWAVQHYHLPFNQLIVNFPTWLLGTVATTLYWRRTR